jgi:hypothetical protein
VSDLVRAWFLGIKENLLQHMCNGGPHKSGPDGCREQPSEPGRKVSSAVSPSSTTPLASRAINASGDSLEVVLVQPAGNPTVIMIRWPDAPTITTPATFNASAAEAMKILAYASTRYAQIRAQRRC